jgi:CubicO group peptidase (beta-lactamase class C family)
MTVPVEGRCEPGFEPVRAAFEACFTALGEVGAATCVYLDGRPVVDLWGGVADERSTRRWQADTLVHVYSVTKPFVAVCLLLLVDRGLVDLDAPVARYWPEFAQAGKAEVPVRWLLTHQAGLPGLHAPQPAAAILDWDRIVALLAAEPPWWPPGTRHGEHAFFFGHLVGEVVRRVSGQSLGAFLRSQVAHPWALDFFVGLSAAELPRCATVVGMDDAWRASLDLAPGTLRERASHNPPGMLDGDVINGAPWRQAQVPAVNGHGSARAIARFYGGLACGGVLDGVRLLSEPLLRSAASVHSSGVDMYLEDAVNWGLGFMVDVDGFGMGGLGGALGWGDPDKRLGFAYVTNRMADHDRAMAVYEAVAAAPGLDAGV